MGINGSGALRRSRGFFLILCNNICQGFFEQGAERFSSIDGDMLERLNLVFI